MSQRSSRQRQDTPKIQLRQSMLAALVTGVHLEFLIPRDETTQKPMFIAEPTGRSRGKQKNHVVLRFEIGAPFDYWKQGERKTCKSVKASIEPDDSNVSWECSAIHLQAMGNDTVPSNSASAAFKFGYKRDCTVRDFVNVASTSTNPKHILLPFTYIEVSRSLRREYSGARLEELWDPNANGCRDFTAQWFTLLYQAGYVEWTAYWCSFRDPPSLEFDSIMAFRYSKERGRDVQTHHSRIVMAVFPRSAVRQHDVLVNGSLKQLPYEVEISDEVPGYDPRNYTKAREVYQSNPADYPWDYQPLPVSTGGGSSSSQSATSYPYSGGGSSSSQYTAYPLQQKRVPVLADTQAHRILPMEAMDPAPAPADTPALDTAANTTIPDTPDTSVVDANIASLEWTVRLNHAALLI